MRVRAKGAGLAGLTEGQGVSPIETGEDFITRVAGAVPETRTSGPPVLVGRMVPWAGDCYPAFGPGHSELLDAFRRRRVGASFAREHVSGSGTIDGGIRSGQDGARRLLEPS